MKCEVTHNEFGPLGVIENHFIFKWKSIKNFSFVLEVLQQKSLNGNISLSEPMNIFEYDLDIKYPQN